MANVTTGDSYAQLISLIRRILRKGLFICNKKERHGMLRELRGLERMYAEVEDRVQGLERQVRDVLLRRIRAGFKALRWLSTFIAEPSSSRSKWRRFKRRVRRAIFYLVGQNILSFALSQMDTIMGRLQLYEEKQKQRETSFYMVKIYEGLEALEIHFDQCCRLVNFVRGTKHVLTHSANIESNTINGQSVSSPSRGDGRLRHRSTTRYEEQASGASEQSRRPTKKVSSGIHSMPNKPDLSDEDIVESVCAEPDDEAKSSQAHIESTPSDEDNDDVSSISSDEVDVASDIETNSSDSDGTSNGGNVDDDFSWNEEEEELSETASTSDADSGSPPDSTATDAEDHEAGTFLGNSTHDSEGDPASSNTGNDPRPETAGCSHRNASIHSWNWSLIVYAASGTHKSCKDCGNQWSSEEFSSLVERSETGGAKLNMQHIKGLRWWPGGAWSWK